MTPGMGGALVVWSGTGAELAAAARMGGGGTGVVTRRAGSVLTAADLLAADLLLGPEDLRPVICHDSCIGCIVSYMETR